eukprot:TRINITY_DN63291_c0_g1_i1.p1 TRINITY_DN63291_c0_g1~~TRINITY_DN63291_c0_g1_i1.p1  ORF type:complete len:560 (+),score=149.14 TRINITY_DN63291_c0_g1_i1:82-1761(+)
MSFDQQEVARRIDWLNGEGGFEDALIEEKVFEAAEGLSTDAVLKILDDLEQNRDNVKNPNAYATSAMRKLRQGGGDRSGGGGGGSSSAGGRGGAPMSGRMQQAPDYSHLTVEQADEKLRKRIKWLNTQGGFDNALNYAKIVEAADGLEYSGVMMILKQVEEKRDEVKDANAWVCAGLRKEARSAAGAQWGGAVDFGPPGYAAAPPMYGQQYAQPLPYEQPMQMAAARQPVDPELKRRISKRVNWLNGNMDFETPLVLEKVLEASDASGGLDGTWAMKVLKDLEEKKDTIRDPTAYVCSAFRKHGAAARSAAAMPAALPPAPAPGWGYAPPLAPAAPAAVFYDVAPAFDEKAVRKKIGWLNNKGGFDNALIYDKIIEAVHAANVDSGTVLRVLGQVEEKVGEVKDPNAWVTSALRKSGGRGPAAAAPPPAAFYAPPAAPMPQYHHAPLGWGGPPPMPAAGAMDVDMDARIRKKIGWLNNNGFDNAINYKKVVEASEGVDGHLVLEVLKQLEEAKGEVRDPTAYATSAIRKRRGQSFAGKGGRASHGGAAPVRRTINKHRD